MRLMEALRLRVKDVDFSRHEILIRDGKGMKDGATMIYTPHAQSWRIVGAESFGSIVHGGDSLMSCNLPLISLLVLAVAFAARLFI